MSKKYFQIEVEPTMLTASEVSAGYPQLQAYLTIQGQANVSSNPRLIVDGGTGATWMVVKLLENTPGPGTVVQEFDTADDARAWL